VSAPPPTPRLGGEPPLVSSSAQSRFVGSLALLGVLVVVGFAGVMLAWRGSAASIVGALQLPYAVSGAIGGVAVLGFALGIASIQVRRRAEAAERAELARVIAAAVHLLAAARKAADR
jgi:hypothetical protein